MKTVMVINSKGGSGKTTIAVNIAAYYAHKGLDVTLVDLDPQRSSLDWLENRPLSKPKIKGNKVIQKSKIEYKNICSLAKSFPCVTGSIGTFAFL